MPRDANGNYTLPPANPVVAGTVIEADGWANPTLQDIAAALSDSLSRTGAGGMQVAFKNADGTMLAPGDSWVNEPTSGWYRAGLNDFRLSVGNEDILRVTKTGIALAPGKIATNIQRFTAVQDDQPAILVQGEEWYESDTGGFYMRYVNPDSTQTLIALGQVGGDFVPFAMKGAANGVAELGPDGRLLASQVPGGGLPGGFATLDVNGKVPLSQLPTPPAGTVFDFAGTVVPAGYLPCDGAAVDRVTFADLFAAIGIAWGAGDGVATFNVPNMARRVAVGSGGAASGTLGNNVGAVGGEETHVLTIPEMPAHTHTTARSSHVAGAGETDFGTTNQNFNSGSTGGGLAHNNLQPSAVMLKIIKT